MNKTRNILLLIFLILALGIKSSPITIYANDNVLETKKIEENPLLISFLKVCEEIGIAEEDVLSMTRIGNWDNGIYFF